MNNVAFFVTLEQEMQFSRSKFYQIDQYQSKTVYIYISEITQRCSTNLEIRKFWYITKSWYTWMQPILRTVCIGSSFPISISLSVFNLFSIHIQTVCSQDLVRNWLQSPFQYNTLCWNRLCNQFHTRSREARCRIDLSSLPAVECRSM